MSERPGRDTRKAPTWYVMEPRDLPCWEINPPLWQEFRKRRGGIEPDPLFTEAYCVQWMDQQVVQESETA